MGPALASVTTSGVPRSLSWPSGLRSGPYTLSPLGGATLHCLTAGVNGRKTPCRLPCATLGQRRRLRSRARQILDPAGRRSTLRIAMWNSNWR